MGTLHMSVQRANETAVAVEALQLAGADPQLALFVSEGPMCPNEKPVTSETKGRGSDPRRHGASNFVTMTKLEVTNSVGRNLVGL